MRERERERERETDTDMIFASTGGIERLVKSTTRTLIRFTTVVAMACGGSNRFCAYVEKIYRFGCFIQQRKSSTMMCVKSRLASRTNDGVLFQHCQNKKMSGFSWMPDNQTDLYKLVNKDFFHNIQLKLNSDNIPQELRSINTYYLDGRGKAMRPVLTVLMARASNSHKGRNVLLHSQQQIAIISEIIHTASLLQDDVCDYSDIRRGKPSANVLWNQSKIIMAGDYFLATVYAMLSRIQNNEVIDTVMQIISDIIEGEFMQFGFTKSKDEKFAHYLKKTYLKTATLMANCCKAVAILSEVDDHMIEMAFQYGKNIGLAFSLVDDILDFATDLKDGLVTAPLLFACKRYPELNVMIMRRFQEPEDVEKASKLVQKSSGFEETKILAKKYSAEAKKDAQFFTKSSYQKALIIMADLLVNRTK